VTIHAHFRCVCDFCHGEIATESMELTGDPSYPMPNPNMRQYVFKLGGQTLHLCGVCLLPFREAYAKRIEQLRDQGRIGFCEKYQG